MANKGIPISIIRAEGERKRQSILNCQAYRGGDRFTAAEGAKVLKHGDGKYAYHLLMGMCDDGLLVSHKAGNSVRFSKPGVAWLRQSWRVHTNEALGVDQVLLDESLGSL
jgi:hypothetical protein